MAQFICEKQGRCCPHEFYDSIEQAISDSEDGVPCDHLVEVSPVRHGRWYDKGALSCRCSECGCKSNRESNYYPNCGCLMLGGDRDDKVSDGFMWGFDEGGRP